MPPFHEFNVGGLRRASRDVALDRGDRRKPGVGDVARRLLGLLDRVIEIELPGGDDQRLRLDARQRAQVIPPKPGVSPTLCRS